MSEDTVWIAEYLRRGVVSRRDFERLVFGPDAESARKASERRRAEEQDRREWIDGIRRRLGLVSEVHEYRTWKIAEDWWAWECLRPGCFHAGWQQAGNFAGSRGSVIAKAAAHRRRFVPAAPDAAPGAGLDLTGRGPVP